MTSDLIALILQSVGGGIADQASTKEGRNNGVHIMVGGLSFQIISLTLFISLAAEFFLKVKKDRARMRSTNWAAGQGPPTSPKGYKTFVWGASFVSLSSFASSTNNKQHSLSPHSSSSSAPPTVWRNWLTASAPSSQTIKPHS
jgi:hypothetical protein